KILNRSSERGFQFCQQFIPPEVTHLQQKRRLRDALNSALDEEMSADPKAFLMGKR
ncbi:unnamed protein product, partial [Ilex paraguariensis]